ncbi:MAG: hypothetical protein EOP52_05270 [Sphingobacteriales bacterium]|nr:MAG: hypothetical protein EOP52_05270 [Sphingobacteriales bacterium]
MWGKQNKVWTRYQQEVVATDLLSAVVLLGYLRFIAVKKTSGYTQEVVDLQRYKVIRKPAKVRQILKEKKQVPFVFAYGLN